MRRMLVAAVAVGMALVVGTGSPARAQLNAGVVEGTVTFTMSDTLSERLVQNPLGPYDATSRVHGVFR